MALCCFVVQVPVHVQTGFFLLEKKIVNGLFPSKHGCWLLLLIYWFYLFVFAYLFTLFVCFIRVMNVLTSDSIIVHITRRKQKVFEKIYEMSALYWTWFSPNYKYLKLTSFLIVDCQHLNKRHNKTFKRKYNKKNHRYSQLR